MEKLVPSGVEACYAIWIANVVIGWQLCCQVTVMMGWRWLLAQEASPWEKHISFKMRDVTTRKGHFYTMRKASLSVLPLSSLQDSFQSSVRGLVLLTCLQSCSFTHRESPWGARTWRRRRSTRCPPPRRTCTSRSRPPSRCSWSPWTPAAPGYRRCSLCPRPDWLRGGRPCGPSCCRTPSSSPGTSTWRSWRTGARSGTALLATGPPGRWARRRWSLRPGRLDGRTRSGCRAEEPAEVASGSFKKPYNTFIVSAELFSYLEPPAPTSPKIGLSPFMIEI